MSAASTDSNFLTDALDTVKLWITEGVNWIIDQIALFLDYLFNALIDLLNFLILVFAGIVDFVVSLLPVDASCQFPSIPSVPFQELINFINWILPVEFMACVIGAVVASYTLYFTVGRLLKFIQVL